MDILQFDFKNLIEFIQELYSHRTVLENLKTKLDSIEGKVDKLIMSGQEALKALQAINDNTNTAAGVVSQIQTVANEVKADVEALLANTAGIPADVADALTALAPKTQALADSLGPVKTFLEGVASEANPTPPPPPPPTV